MNELKGRARIVVLGVNITSSTIEDELRLIASDPDADYFRLESFNRLLVDLRMIFENVGSSVTANQAIYFPPVFHT